MKKLLATLFLVGFGFSVMPAMANECEVNGEVDWDCMCHILCAAGDGGLACNCDIIP
ncbi:hypothetical protein RM407_002296 [Enterobacter kobei]|nr:hypothetical protein [Enterobacter kobei]